MAANKNVTVRLLADASQYEASIAKAGASTDKLAGGLEKTGSKTGLIGKGITAAGLGVAAFGVAAVKMAADFDQQMSTVQANTDASASQLDQLRAAAIQAGADTVYSASESAGAVNELGKAGLSTTDILSGGLSGALNLAASDGMDVSDAAELMSTSLKQFNLSGSDATMVADALAAGAGKAVGSAQDLGYALNQSGLMAHSMGIDVQTTTGTLAAFANAGLIGSDAGTSLKTMLQSLSNPTKKAKEEMDSLNLAAYDSQGNFVGLDNFAGQLKDSLGGLTQEERNSALAIIFGSDAVRAANVLYDQGSEGIQQWTKDVSQSGFAADQAAAKNNNLKGDLENLSGSFESLMISVGEGGQGPLRSIVKTVDMLVDGFGQLPAPAQQTIVVIGALAGVAGGLHKVLGPLNTSTSTLGQSFGMAVDPIQRFSSAWPQLVEGVKGFGSAISPSMSALEAGTPTISRSASAMGGLKNIAGGVVNLLGGPWGIALGVASWALMDWAQKAQIAKQNADAVNSALESTGDATEQIIKNLTEKKIDDSWIIPDGIEQAYYGYKTLGDAVKGVGIDMGDMAAAAEGNAGALYRVHEVTDKMIAQGGKQKELAGIILSNLDDETQSYRKSSAAVDDKKKALESATDANGAATTATEASTDAIEEQGETANVSADDIDKLAKSIYGLENWNLGADESLTALRQKMLDLSDEVADCTDQWGNHIKVLDDNGNALAGQEKAAYGVQSSMQNLAESAETAATKILQQGQASGTLDEATEKAKTSINEAREAFIKHSAAAGMDETQAGLLADAYGLQSGKVDELREAVEAVPEDHNTNLTATDNATPVISSVVDALKQLKDKDITITQWMNYVSTGEQPNQYGPYKDGYRSPQGATGGLFDGTGFLPGYANGGTVLSGLLHGPGTGTSDSIWLSNARVATGEYVNKKTSVDYYGSGLFDALNSQRIPREMFAKAPQAIVQTPQAQSHPVTFVQNVEIKHYSSGSTGVDDAVLVSKIRAQTNTLLQGGRL